MDVIVAEDSAEEKGLENSGYRSSVLKSEDSWPEPWGTVHNIEAIC